MATRLAKSAVILGIATAAVAVIASAAAWWRWERIDLFLGEVPLPPGSEVVRSVEPGEGRKYHSAVIRSGRTPDEVRAFYKREMEVRGWRLEEESELKGRYRSGRKLLRLVLHSNPEGTVFTLSLRF